MVFQLTCERLSTQLPSHQSLNRGCAYNKTSNPPITSTFPLVSPPILSFPYTRTIPKVSITKGLGIILSTWLSAEDFAVNAANQACMTFFYLKRSFAAILLPLYQTFIRPHLTSMNFIHELTTAGHWAKK